MEVPGVQGIRKESRELGPSWDISRLGRHLQELITASAEEASKLRLLSPGLGTSAWPVEPRRPGNVMDYIGPLDVQRAEEASSLTCNLNSRSMELLAANDWYPEERRIGN
ncbi:unnamed protein product [Lampetra planeri]